MVTHQTLTCLHVAYPSVPVVNYVDSFLNPDRLCDPVVRVPG
jgi:hypothetical protein